MTKTYDQRIAEYREFHENDPVCRHGEWAYDCEICNPEPSEEEEE